jgi:N,N'-diacetylchitobiose transport system substrate-binding protein
MSEVQSVARGAGSPERARWPPVAAGDNDRRDKASTSTRRSSSGSIDVWIMDPARRAPGRVKGYATDFQAANPGTKVNIQFVPWAQAHDKFTTAIAGGKVPDVAEMGTTWTPEFADQGAFQQMPKAESGVYVSSLIDAATLDGKVWGKPWYAGARGLIYRKDILKKAGVAVPKTWADVDKAAAAIKAKVPGVYPIGYTGLSEHMYLPTIWQAGGQIATQNGDTWKSAINSPEAAKALDYYASFYKDGSTRRPRSAGRSRTRRPRSPTATSAMLIAGGWTYNSIIATKPISRRRSAPSWRPAGPSGKTRRSPAGATRAVPGVQEQGPRRGVRRLHARARRS